MSGADLLEHLTDGGVLLRRKYAGLLRAAGHAPQTAKAESGVHLPGIVRINGSGGTLGGAAATVDAGIRGPGHHTAAALPVGSVPRQRRLPCLLLQRLPEGRGEGSQLDQIRRVGTARRNPSVH